MAGAESKHLRRALGQRVRCDLDKPDRREEGKLIELRASGPRVRFDDGHGRSWWASLSPAGVALRVVILAAHPRSE